MGVAGSEGLALLSTGTILLVASLWLMHRGAWVLNPHRLSIAGFFYLSFIPMIYIPSFIVFFENPGPYRYPFILGVMSSMITVPLGVLAANAVLRYDRAENERYFASPLQSSASNSAIFYVCLLVSLAAAALTIAYFSRVRIGSLPLVYMFSNPGDVTELTLLREDAFKLLDPRWGSESSTVLFYGFLFLRTLVRRLGECTRQLGGILQPRHGPPAYAPAQQALAPPPPHRNGRDPRPQEESLSHSSSRTSVVSAPAMGGTRTRTSGTGLAPLRACVT